MQNFIKRSLAATGALLAGSALLLAPTAFADPGDQTFNINDFGVEFASDACPGAFGQITIEGAPEVADDYLIYFGGQGCTVRARFVGVAGADGRTIVDTGYATTSSNDGFFGVPGVFRCYVEFGVQRANGTFYTRNILPDQQESQNCPE